MNSMNKLDARCVPNHNDGSNNQQKKKKKSAEQNQRQKDLNVQYNETSSVSMSSGHRLHRWLMNPLGSFHLRYKRTVAFVTEPMWESVLEEGAMGDGGSLIIVTNVIKKLALVLAENHKQTFWFWLLAAVKAPCF